MAGDDRVVGAIDARRRTGEPISFAWLRQRYARQNDSYGTLKYGTAVLGSLDQLDQYLWQYGPMVASQWRHAAPSIPSMVSPMVWIDYGCGQGLAGLLLHDLGGPAIFADVKQILLIEPSPLALARARAVYEHLAPRSEVRTICKSFDDVKKGQAAPGGLETLHLFSNVLDVAGFDAPALLFKALQPGRNVIVAVSPDRNFDGGTARLVDLKQRIDNPNLRAQLTVVRNELTTFACDNAKKAPAVLWVCEVNLHG